MRVQRISIKDINFDYQEYSASLKASIIRIGLSFPIKVNIIDNQYYCIDGHKRLSVIKDLITEDNQYLPLGDINIIVLNNGSTRSNDCWNGRNTH